MYLLYDDFIKKYPSTEAGKMKGGSTSEVYRSGNQVIKTGLANYLLNDVNMLSAISHPNIISVTDYTLTFNLEGKEIVLFASPAGDCDVSTYMRSCINKMCDEEYFAKFKEIAFQLLSAVVYLHRRGIVHADIKPHNIVMIGDKPMLIDFGLAKVCTPHRDDLVFLGPGYTATFSDPSYIPEVYNSISCDVFALAKTFYCMLLTKKYICSNLFEDVKDIDPNFHELLLQMTSEQGTRSSAEEFLTHSYFRGLVEPSVPATKTYLLVNYVEPVSEVERYREAVSKFMKMTSWVLEFACAENLSINTLFLILHNIHRTATLYLSFLKEEAQLFTAVHCALVLYTTTHVVEYSLFKFLGFTREKFHDCMCKVLDALGGAIYSETLWDYSTTPLNLWHNLRRSLKWEYEFLGELEVSLFDETESDEESGQDAAEVSNIRMSDSEDLSSTDTEEKGEIVLLSGKFIESATRRHQGWKTNPFIFYKMVYDETDPTIDYDTVSILRPPSATFCNILKIQNYEFDIIKDFGIVCCVKDEMVDDAEFANGIFNRIVHTNDGSEKQYDILFGKEKIEIARGRRVSNFAINSYTCSVEELRAALCNRHSVYRKLPIT